MDLPSLTLIVLLSHSCPNTIWRPPVTCIIVIQFIRRHVIMGIPTPCHLHTSFSDNHRAACRQHAVMTVTWARSHSQRSNESKFCFMPKYLPRQHLLAHVVPNNLTANPASLQHLILPPSSSWISKRKRSVRCRCAQCMCSSWTVSSSLERAPGHRHVAQACNHCYAPPFFFMIED